MLGTAFIKHVHGLSANELEDAITYINRLIKRHLLPADYIEGISLDTILHIYFMEEKSKRDNCRSQRKGV